jgi:hypothetical protein
MVIVYLQSGECEEVEDATSANRIADHVLCFGPAGDVVRSFNADNVTLFTSDPEMVEIVREEVCEDDAETAPA